MRHYPVFLDPRDRRVVVSGAGDDRRREAAAADEDRGADRRSMAPIRRPRCGPGRREGRLVAGRAAARAAATPPGAALVYGANGDAAEDARAAAIGRAAGALVNIVDNLEDSDFITPAIVDRDPVTVAIGTEGAAPVLARKIKAEVEAMLPATLGLLTRIGQAFRARVEALDFEGAPRRSGPASTSSAGRGRWPRARRRRAASSSGCSPRATRRAQGFVHLVGAGPGDPELLTLKARRLLHEADVVIHDRLVPPAILELARREATIVEAGKTGFRAVLEAGGHQRADASGTPRAGATRGAAEGRRPGGLRAARRGDRGAGGGGHRLADRARRHRGQRGGGGDRPVADPARPQLGVPHPDRPRRRTASPSRTGASWPSPGAAAAVYMGVAGRDLPARPAADARRAAPTRRSRRSRTPAAPDQRVIATTLIELPAALAEAAPDGAGDDPLRAGAARGGAGARPSCREAL